MVERRFVSPPSHTLTLVNNTILGYRMGPLRALAQEPVQNSKDQPSGDGRVHVEYRLHSRRDSQGQPCYLLTVTDWNTTGIQGSVRDGSNPLDVKGELPEGENWAAWEGMGYTKKPEEEKAGGSRGQGKSAFLYHSDLHMMLYDTLLAEGEYRLGIRWANPSDGVMQPPYFNDEAREVIRTSCAILGSDQVIPLGMTPLEQVGARIIVPYLAEDAVTAFRSGELYQWLQRCWWRAIQQGLVVTLVDEAGHARAVEVPAWWAGEPWKRSSGNVLTRENIRVGEDLIIKRVVLSYDDSLTAPDLGESTEDDVWWGVQLLRGQQWIDTLSSNDLGTHIPDDRRAGFRGFVEFDEKTEGLLKKDENPQHEQFRRSPSVVKPLIRKIADCVKEFSLELGWTTRGVTQQPPGAEANAARKFLSFFTAGNAAASRVPQGASQNQLSLFDDTPPKWTCELHLGYPTPNTTRVNWGERVTNVKAFVSMNPHDALKNASLILELVPPEGVEGQREVSRQTVEMVTASRTIDLGDFQIIKGVGGKDTLRCPEPGRWRLKARVVVDDQEEATDSVPLYVAVDPPAVTLRPYSVSIQTSLGLSPQRINSGETFDIQVTVTSRDQVPREFGLSASIGEALLADAVTQRVPTSGIPVGATPKKAPGYQGAIVVNPPTPPPARVRAVQLPPGKHIIAADLELNGSTVAHDTYTLWVDEDPPRPEGGLPFKTEQTLEHPHPKWRFEKGDDFDTLYYPKEHMLYRELSVSNRAGVNAFVLDVCAEGLVEWTMEPLDSGSDARLNAFLDSKPDVVSHETWQDVADKMKNLANHRHSGDVFEYTQGARDLAARLLFLYEGSQ